MKTWKISRDRKTNINSKQRSRFLMFTLSILNIKDLRSHGRARIRLKNTLTMVGNTHYILQTGQATFKSNLMDTLKSAA